MKNSFLFLILAMTAGLSFTGYPTALAMVVPDRREFPINSSINPCENFYEYTCSKVISSFQLPEDRSRHTFSFSDPHERILEYKKNYFSKLKSIQPENDRELQLKNYYNACMNSTSRATEEREWVKKWNQKMDSLNSKTEISEFFGEQVLTPESGIVSYGTDSNQDRPTYNDVYFDTSLLKLPEKTYYDKPETVKDLEALYVTFFKTIGRSDPEKRAQAALALEKELSKNYPTPNEFRDLFSSRTQITVAQIKSQFPLLKLDQLLKRIPKHTHIRNIIPKSMKFLNQTLKSGDLEALKDLYLLNIVSGYLDDAYPDFFKQRFDFIHKHLGGSATRPDRHERCTKITMGHFQMEVDAILWPRLFPNFPKQKFISMAEKIRQSLLTMIEANTWLSKKAKAEATKKIATAKLQLVAPETDEEWDFNPKASYSDSNPIANQKIRAALLIEKELKELQGPVSTLRWGMGPLTINAYYNPPYNKFVLPVGILQYPFYDAKQPESLNLAAIGTVIGHELGHAIDDKGSKYDAAGMLKPWMDKKDLENFKSRSSKLVGQFAKTGHNGELTLGENIGDLVGLTTSFQASFVNPKTRTTDPKAEDLKVRMQEFFISYGRVWCNVQRPSYTELQLKTDPHSLGIARTNEQMKLQPAFQEAFSCKNTDAMVLPDSERVNIWW
jgi:putative endopeptidase